MSGHSILAPSGADTWSRCVGAPYLCKGLPDIDAEYNASGTCSHHLLNWALTHEVEGSQYILTEWIGQELQFGGFKFLIDEARIDRVKQVVDKVTAEPGQMWTEMLVKTSPFLGVPDQSGHADIIKLDLDGFVEVNGVLLKGVLSVHDFKDGNLQVDARDKLQLLCYAAGALYAMDLVGEINAIRTVIHQPKIHHYDEWSYTREEIETFCAIIRGPAKVAYDIYHGNVEFDPEKHLVAGEAQCFWCKVRGRCSARAKRMVELFAPLIERYETDNGTLEGLHSHLDEVEQAAKDIRAELERRAMCGTKLETLKLVMGNKGHRYWKDPKKAEDLLNFVLPEDKVYPPRKIITPTQAEAALGKKAYGTFKSLVDQPPAGYMLVSRTHKKPEVEIQQFPIVQEPTE